MIRISMLLILSAIAGMAHGTVLDVISFGAKGDGRSDDTEAVRRAAAKAVPGDTIRFSGGTFFLTGDIEISTGNIVIDGDGTILFDHKPAAEGRPMNKLLLTGKNISVRDLRITSNAKSRSAAHGLISCRDAENIFIDRVDISFSPSVAIWTMNCRNVRITNSFIHRQWADGIHISRETRGVIIAGNTIDNNGDDGIGVVSYHDNAPWNKLPRNDSVVITGNVISNTPARGICASGGNLLISGNRIFNTGKAGIICTREGWISEQTLISSNIIGNTGTAEKYGFDFYDSRGTRSGIHVQTNSNLVISDNIIYGAKNGGAGITLSAVADSVVRGNKISDCSRGVTVGSPKHYTTPEKKMPESIMKQIYANYKVIPEFAGSDNILISGNFIKRMDRDGIYAAGCPERKITGLVLEGNVLSDNNTGNHDHVRDIWADWLERSVIRDNVSLGTQSEKKLSPVQGIGKGCARTLFRFEAAEIL